jgi:hypothetical protein
LPVDRSGIAHRAFLFRRGRRESGGRSLLNRHVGRIALVSGAAGHVRKAWSDDRARRDALRSEHPFTAPSCFPLSGDGATIDHVLGATNYHSLREDEPQIKPGIVRMQWI